MNQSSPTLPADQESVVAAVTELLETRRPGGVTLEVDTTGVRQKDDWWYVPVRPSDSPARRYEYYDALAEIESELLVKNHLTVMILPASPYSVNFRFRRDSSDQARAATMGSFRERYPAGGAGAVENAHWFVQPGWDYWVLVDNRREAEAVADVLRKSPIIDEASVTVERADPSLREP